LSAAPCAVSAVIAVWTPHRVQASMLTVAQRLSTFAVSIRGDGSITWCTTACGRKRVCPSVVQPFAEAQTGFLCIGCLEERLRRKLTIDDFTKLPVNEPFPSDTERLARIKREKRQRPGSRHL
jgi:hypothetical protein